MRHPIRTRRGFTLVEMLVAAALIVLILSIFAVAFATATDALVTLRATGDMAAGLRDASTTIRDDLAAYHFEGSRRVSDSNFWDQGPPREGFFRIWQGSKGTFEGNGTDGIESWRSTDHALHFTVRKTGNRRADYFWTQVPLDSRLLTPGPFDPAPDASYRDGDGRYTSQWAEVAYFLRKTGDTSGPPLFALYRRKLLVVPNTASLNWPPVPADPKDYLGVSARVNPAGLYFNNPTDLTVPQRRFGMDPDPNKPGVPAGPGGTYPVLAEQSADLAGSDLLLGNVLSFDVRVLPRGGDDFVDLYSFTPGGDIDKPMVFDTWSQSSDDVYDYSGWDRPGTTQSVPLRVSLEAVQIVIRVWHPQTHLTRQMTIVQGL